MQKIEAICCRILHEIELILTSKQEPVFTRISEEETIVTVVKCYWDISGSEGRGPLLIIMMSSSHSMCVRTLGLIESAGHEKKWGLKELICNPSTHNSKYKSSFLVNLSVLLLIR